MARHFIVVYIENVYMDQWDGSRRLFLGILSNHSSCDSVRTRCLYIYDPQIWSNRCRGILAYNDCNVYIWNLRGFGICRKHNFTDWLSRFMVTAWWMIFVYRYWMIKCRNDPIVLFVYVKLLHQINYFFILNVFILSNLNIYNLRLRKRKEWMSQFSNWCDIQLYRWIMVFSCINSCFDSFP